MNVRKRSGSTEFHIVAGRHKRLMKSRLGSVTRTAFFLDVSDGRGADGITLKDRYGRNADCRPNSPSRSPTDRGEIMEQLAKGLRDPRQSVEMCFVDDTRQVDFEILHDEIMSAR